jgi:alginate O-acetyltransferase complex protein AlgI
MAWYYIAILTLLAGFVCMKMLQKNTLRIIIWVVPLLDIIGGYLTVADSRPWYKMMVYIFLLFLGMKAVTVTYRYSGIGRLNFLQWLAFSLGWPGMDPLPFEQLGKGKRVYYSGLVTSGLISFTAGALLLILLACLLKYHVLHYYIICLLSFIPVVMVFHAGLFNIGAALWGLMGVQLSPLMDAPWKSDSVGSFWGRRWNIAFIQMTKITLFIPLARKGKSRLALLLSFFISGIFHEVALSLPAGSGYGLPMLYFILQSVLVLAERKFIHKLSSIARKTWTFICLLLPFPLLLHPGFIHEIMLPFLKSLSMCI